MPNKYLGNNKTYIIGGPLPSLVRYMNGFDRRLPLKLPLNFIGNALMYATVRPRTTRERHSHMVAPERFMLASKVS